MSARVTPLSSAATALSVSRAWRGARATEESCPHVSPLTLAAPARASPASRAHSWPTGTSHACPIFRTLCSSSSLRRACAR